MKLPPNDSGYWVGAQSSGSLRSRQPLILKNQFAKFWVMRDVVSWKGWSAPLCYLSDTPSHGILAVPPRCRLGSVTLLDSRFRSTFSLSRTRRFTQTTDHQWWACQLRGSTDLICLAERRQCEGASSGRVDIVATESSMLLTRGRGFTHTT